MITKICLCCEDEFEGEFDVCNRCLEADLTTGSLVPKTICVACGSPTSGNVNGTPCCLRCYVMGNFQAVRETQE